MNGKKDQEELKLYDISLTIAPDMIVYKNKPEKRPSLTVTQDFKTSSVHEGRVCLDTHTGTHLDAPLHMLPEGGTIETIPVERLIRPAQVIDLTEVTEGGIEEKHLKGHAPFAPGSFVLLKTQNSIRHRVRRDFDFDFIYLAKSGAAYLAETGIVGVGIDALGIERNQSGHPTHKTLMARDILIAEGLDLYEVSAGTYTLILAPLKIQGADGGPARAYLLEKNIFEEDEHS